MAITLAISDTGDGTGAVATVAGSGGGSTNTLTKAAWSGDVGSIVFSAAGSRSGDGTIAVSTANGLWLWQLVNSSGTVVIAYQPTSGGVVTESVAYRIMTQMQTQIRALALTDVSSSNVLLKWMPRDFGATVDPKPEIVICPAPLPETMRTDLAGTDHIGYPILVAKMNAQNQDYAANLSRNLLHREKLRREFISQGMAGIAEVNYCRVEPQAMIDPKWFKGNDLYDAMIFRFTARELRGN